MRRLFGQSSKATRVQLVVKRLGIRLGAWLTPGRRIEAWAIVVAAVVTILGVLGLWLAHAAVRGSSDATAVAILLVPLITYAVAAGRLTGVKGPAGLEASFQTVAQLALQSAATQPDTSLPSALAAPTDQGAVPAGAPGLQAVPRLDFATSHTDEILEQIAAAVASAQPLIEVDLGQGDRWWNTRIYLVAALADDFTDVQAIAFVADIVSRPRQFVGTATPKQVRRALEPFMHDWAAEYRSAVADATKNPIPPGLDSPVKDVMRILSTRLDQAKLAEKSIRQVVSEPLLRGYLGAFLDSSAVEWITTPMLTPTLVQQILSSPNRWVALTIGGTLLQSVDRCALGTQLALATLAQP